MATFINRVCRNDNCESHGVKTLTGDKYKPLCEVVGGSRDAYQLKCGTCGTVFEDARPEKRKTMSYPYNCSSTGQVFNSYSEQRSYEKANGLEPL